MSEKDKEARFKSRRSRVLYELTLLMAGLYILGGLAAFFIASGTFNRLAEDSTDKLIQDKAQTISSSYSFLAQAELEVLITKFGVENIDRFALYEKLLKGEKDDLDPLQDFLIEETKKMTISGLLDMEYVFMVIPPNPLTPNPITFVASEPDLVFMQLPEEIASAVEQNKEWILINEGIEELGLEKEQLVTFAKIESPVAADVLITFVGITPMSESISEVRDFYNEEKNKKLVNYSIIASSSVVIIIALSYFVLRHLIRKRITEPIDILSEEAEELMKGNLDIDIVVHEGGEFEDLESAIKEMVESFRKYIAKSMSDE